MRSYPFEVGMVVAATKQIIEGDVPHNPEVKKCEDGWRHAHLGDTGVVEHISEEDVPTVRFKSSGTATIVLESEITYVADYWEQWKRDCEFLGKAMAEPNLVTASQMPEKCVIDGCDEQAVTLVELPFSRLNILVCPKHYAQVVQEV